MKNVAAIRHETVPPPARETMPWPILAHWDITYGCNFRCSFCLTASGCPAENEFSTEEAKATIDKLYAAGVLYLRVLGGEPFFRKDTLDIFRYAAEKGMLLSFSTNASLVTPERARELYALGDALRYVQVSLYGSDEVSHALTTRSKTPLARVRQGIRALAEAGLEVTILVVATYENVDRIAQYYSLAEQSGAADVRLTPVIAVGRGAEDELFLDERVDLWVRLIHKALEIQAHRKSSSPRLFIEARPLLGAYLRSEGVLDTYWQNCQAGLSMIFLDPAGKVAPCPFVHNLKEGLREQYQFFQPQEMKGKTITEIWNSEVFSELRRFHDPSQNAYPIETRCRFYGSGECVPCALTPCGCVELIRNIRLAMVPKARTE